MKLNHVVVASLAALASELVLAQTAVGRTVGTTVPWDGASLLTIAAGGLALGIWIVRRKKDK